jgi:hypothetical protein
VVVVEVHTLIHLVLEPEATVVVQEVQMLVVSRVEQMLLMLQLILEVVVEEVV